MPKVTVYVRKDDYPKWQAVEEKTEFIHNALNRDIQKIHDEWDNIENKELYGYKPVRLERKTSVEPLWRNKKKGKL